MESAKPEHYPPVGWRGEESLQGLRCSCMAYVTSSKLPSDPPGNDGRGTPIFGRKLIDWLGKFRDSGATVTFNFNFNSITTSAHLTVRDQRQRRSEGIRTSAISEGTRNFEIWTIGTTTSRASSIPISTRRKFGRTARREQKL